LKALMTALRRRFQDSRFVRGEAPVGGPVVLTHRRIYILPTRRGLGFVLLIAILLLIAFVYNNNLAYLLSFLLASIFFVAILHSFKVLKGLEISAGNQPPVFCGEMAGFNFQVLNPGREHRYAVSLSLQQPRQFDFSARQTRQVSLAMTGERRGWLQCPTLTVSSDFPLGLFRAWSPLRFDSQVLVYPRPAPVFPAFPETGGSDGPQRRQTGNDDEFDGVKAYRRGDSIRHIHWKSLAKGRGLQSKHYSGDGQGGAEQWFDYANTPGAGVEQRLSLLCRWIVEAERAGLRYGLILPDSSVEPACGPAHFHHCLQLLALF